MAVKEIDRDYVRLLHQCDMIESIIAGQKSAGVDENEKKQLVGNIVMMLELEVIDDKWEAAGKDLTRVNSVAAAGRTYWKS